MAVISDLRIVLNQSTSVHGAVHPHGSSSIHNRSVGNHRAFTKAGVAADDSMGGNHNGTEEVEMLQLRCEPLTQRRIR